jgi:hypothetical protein
MPGGSGKFVMVPVGPVGRACRPDQDYFPVALPAVHRPASGALNLSRLHLSSGRPSPIAHAMARTDASGCSVSIPVRAVTARNSRVTIVCR